MGLLDQLLADFPYQEFFIYFTLVVTLFHKILDVRQLGVGGQTEAVQAVLLQCSCPAVPQGPFQG